MLNFDAAIFDLLGAKYPRTVVVEDAVSSVQAGSQGGLINVEAQENNARELRDHGADIVVADLSELTADKINRLIESKSERW